MPEKYSWVQRARRGPHPGSPSWPLPFRPVAPEPWTGRPQPMSTPVPQHLPFLSIPSACLLLWSQVTHFPEVVLKPGPPVGIPSSPLSHFTSWCPSYLKGFCFFEYLQHSRPRYLLALGSRGQSAASLAHGEDGPRWQKWGPEGRGWDSVVGHLASAWLETLSGSRVS